MKPAREYLVDQWRPLTIGGVMGLVVSAAAWLISGDLAILKGVFEDFTAAKAVVLVGLTGSAFAWWLRRSLERQAEERLRVDALIRAVELMRDDAGPGQRAGALLALANLGQVEFALQLLRREWHSQAVEPGPALLIIERGLDSPETQAEAAAIFQENAATCVLDDGTMLTPRQLRSWSPHVSTVEARIELLVGLAKTASAVPDGRRDTLWPSLIQGAAKALDDDSEVVRSEAAFVVEALAEHLTLSDDFEVHDLDGGTWTLGDVKTRAASERGFRTFLMEEVVRTF